MSAPRLVVWGGGSPGTARALGKGAGAATVLSWPGADTAALRGAGVAFRRAEDLLGVPGIAACAATGRSWARVWARLALDGTRSFRDLACWRGESLLWTCESFLAQATAGPRCAATAELCLRLLDALGPREIDARGLADHDAVLLARSATASGVLCHDAPRTARALPVQPVARPHGGLRGFFGLLGGGGGRAVAPPVADGRPRLLFLCAGERSTTALAPVLGALGGAAVETRVVVTSELRRHETRRTREEQSRADERLLSLHRQLAGSAALAASYLHRGVAFADLAADDLEALLRGYLPEAVRQLERACALFDAVRPALVVVSSEAPDERRLLGLAASRCGVPWGIVRPAASVEEEELPRADGGPQPAFVHALGGPADGAAAAERLVDAAGRRVSP